MPQRLLIVASTALLYCSASSAPARAQAIAAGQTSGVVYLDIVPDAVLTATANTPPTTGGQFLTQSLDVDQDGRDDIFFTAAGTIVAGSFYTNYGASLQLRHPDVELYGVGGSGPVGPSAIAVRPADLIELVMGSRNSAGQLGEWRNEGLGVLYILSTDGYGANGPVVGGEWHDTQEHYLGIRLRAAPTAAWRYGWVRAQVSRVASPVSLTLKDYALTSSTLAGRSAVAAGWQLYPLPVTEQLSVQPPPVAVGGTLSITDACGRMLLRAPLSNGRQQVDLSALASGMYLLHLHTATSSLVQRIVKR